MARAGKIDKTEFKRMYLAGTRAKIIRSRFGISKTSYKWMRKALRLPARPNGAPKMDWKTVPTVLHLNVKAGDAVRIEMSNADGTASLANGKTAVVSSVEDWGVHALTNFGSGRIRLHWTEFLPLGVTDLVNPDMTLQRKTPTGNPCPGCGGANLVRTGSCVTCQDCGYNEGCG